MEVDALIFDLDGTLVDSAQDLTDAVNHALRGLDLPPRTRAEIRSFIGDGMKTLLVRATGSADEALIQKAIGLFRPYYAEHCVDATTLYPGTREALDDFQSKKIGLVSNKPLEMCLKILEHFGLRARFSAVIGAESTEQKKPHPAPVLKALELLRRPRVAVMVGDGITDIQAGKSAGIQTCAVTYGFRSRELLKSQQPDFMIDGLSELKKIFS